MNNTSHSRHECSSRTLNRLRATLLALVLVGGAGAFTWTQVNAREESNSPPVKITVNDKPVSRETGVTIFAPIVKKVTPSVVKVYVTGSVKNVAPMKSRSAFTQRGLGLGLSLVKAFVRRTTDESKCDGNPAHFPNSWCVFPHA